MRKGYLRVDDDGHWYFVPSSLISNFDKMYKAIQMTQNWEERDDVIADFVRVFDVFRISGGIFDIEFGANL